MRTRTRLLVHGGVVALIALAAVSPLLTFGAGLVANHFGCRLDEAGADPCPVAGHDLGPALYDAGMAFWLAIVTVPVGAVLVLVHLVVAGVVRAGSASRRRRAA